MNQLWMWVGFNVFVLAMLALDLGVFHRKPHAVSFRESIIWTVVWIVLSLAFSFGVNQFLGRQPALEFLTGYVIEKSLSIDNVFVFIIIFTYFKVPAKYQHEVLFWGILGALIMRAIFIVAGITLLKHFHWIFYVFGAFLIFTGIRLAFEKDKEIHPERNPLLRLFKRHVPTTDRYHDGKFFVRENGKLLATPLFVVLLVIEMTDVIFAVDSIPAILAITEDPFIVYTSNVFAILGLRALYFAMAGVMQLFHHLHYGLAFILSFVGVKMLLTDVYKMPIAASLGIIVSALIISVIASFIWPKQESAQGQHA